MTKKKPIILVGTQGFWSLRDLTDREVFKNRFQFAFSDTFEIDADERKKVCAIVIADQKCGPELMDSFPNLATIARTGTGYDNIDVQAAKDRNIAVTRVAELNAESVSEFALGLIICLTRNIVVLHNNMCASQWKHDKQGLLLTEATVGLVGLGAIGKLLASKLNSLGVKRLIGWNRTVNAKLREKTALFHLELADLNKVMKESDIVVVALALAPETRLLINSQMLSLMKPDAFLVNVSRGAIVDEKALSEFISSGRIAGAALDVYSKEPPSSDLFGKDFFQKLVQSGRAGSNVILTPHNAGITRNSVRNISLQVAKNIVGVIDGKLEEIEIV